LSITPLILGSGRAGHAIAKSLAILNVLRPELDIQAPVWLERGAALDAERAKHDNAVLCISNPHALHARSIIEGDLARFNAILCEKPAGVNMEDLQALRAVTIPTAVLHVIRQTWGIQTLKQMLVEGQVGELIAIEGRYWQASAAERALQKSASASPKGWKNDAGLSGEFDTYLDLATHWVDAATFLVGQQPKHIFGWRSFTNSEAPHRDTHIQLNIAYPAVRGFGSISKTFHGATNQFEISVIGSKMSATWEYLKPDEILIGEGRDRRIVTRKTNDFGSQHPAFHALGWLEGYIDIAARLFDNVYQAQEHSYPTLASSLDVLEAMLAVQWQ
jgi:predicted dehydrogenase